MTLIKLTGGPMDGQEREIADANMMAAEYPGYSPTEQVMDPEKGQTLKAEWQGEESHEAHYKDSVQEQERMGNETGVRDERAQQEMRGQQEQGKPTPEADRERETQAQAERKQAEKKDEKGKK